MEEKVGGKKYKTRGADSQTVNEVSGYRVKCNGVVVNRCRKKSQRESHHQESKMGYLRTKRKIL